MRRKITFFSGGRAQGKSTEESRGTSKGFLLSKQHNNSLIIKVWLFMSSDKGEVLCHAEPVVSTIKAWSTRGGLASNTATICKTKTGG